MGMVKFKDLSEEMQEQVRRQLGVDHIAPDTMVAATTVTNDEEALIAVKHVVGSLDRFEAVNVIGDLLQMLVRTVDDPLPPPPDGKVNGMQLQILLASVEHVRKAKEDLNNNMPAVFSPVEGNA